MLSITLARLAMATRFELLLHGKDAVALRAAGEEALDEIERLDRQLSIFRPESEIAHLNACAAREPVVVSPELFRLLEQARRLSDETGGAFDLTIAPLVRCWGFMAGSGALPDRVELEQCRAITGMRLVQLNPGMRTVHFELPGVMLDPGALGKGYAVERAAAILREAGVTSALIHGGTSTVYGLGRPPGSQGWKVAIQTEAGSPGSAERAIPACSVLLCDEALSVSAAWGKSFVANGKTYGHVLDPRTGWPAAQAVLAAVTGASATETDAFSTALLVLGITGQERISRLRPGIRTAVLVDSPGGSRLVTSGFPDAD